MRRSKIKSELLADRAALSRLFPPEVYNQLAAEPEEVLNYNRDLERWALFTRCSEKEYNEMIWIGGRD